MQDRVNMRIRAVKMEPPRINLKIKKRKQDGSFNLTGLQIAELAAAARQYHEHVSGRKPIEVSWEIDGGLVVWHVTEQEFRNAVAYLGNLGRGRAIEVQRVG